MTHSCPTGSAAQALCAEATSSSPDLDKLVEELRNEARFGWFIAANRQQDTRDLHAKAAGALDLLQSKLRQIAVNSDAEWGRQIARRHFGMDEKGSSNE